jgi:ankyrin repeat protein
LKLLLSKFEPDPEVCNKLLFEATEANHDSVRKVELILDCLPEASQLNKAGQTLLHVGAGGKPPRLDVLELALNKGVDPNIQDRKKDTALHKVTKNYAERKKPWWDSRKAMELLLKQDSIDLNKENAKGKTPLHNLMAARDLSPGLLLMWQAKQAHFVKLDAEEEAVLKSPLADLCKRRDGPQLFKYVSNEEVTQDCIIKYLLQAAVLDGTAEMVKVLLDYGAKANEWNGLFLMMAACSKTDMAMKIKYLYRNGARYTYNDPRRYSVLHAAALSATATKDVVRVCTDPNYLNLKLEQRDRYENTPLHIAAMSKKDSSDVLVGCLADKEQGGDPNAMNRDKKTAFRLALKHNYDKKELRRNKLMVLLERGCLPTRKDFEEYKGNADDFQNLFLSSELVARSRNPIQLLLVLGWYCQHPLADVKPSQPNQSLGKVEETSDWARTVKWRDLSAKFEREAVMIINEFGKKEKILSRVMTHTDIQEVTKMKWEKFLANEYIGKMLNQMFYGRVNALTAEEKPDELEPSEFKTWYLLPFYTVIFLLQSFLLPFYLLFSLSWNVVSKCEGTVEKQSKWTHRILSCKVFAPPDPKKRPVVTVFSYIISYLLFVVFVIMHIVKEDTGKDFTWNEWIILVYVLSMLLDEINQACSFGRKYLTFTNIADDFKILCYLASLILQGIGTANDNLTVLRVAQHVFAMAAMLSCLRLLYYLQVNRRLGPIIISITEVVTDVLLFIVILGIVLVAFAVGITGVFAAGVYTTEFRNGSISLPAPVHGLWPSLKTLYWSLFGEIDLDELNNAHGVLASESVIGLTLVAFWLLASVIVLLNILIALVNEAFDRVKKQNADLVWNLAVSRVITEVNSSPSFPLPMNIFYLLGTFVTFLRTALSDKFMCCRCGPKKSNSKSQAKEQPLLEMPNAKQILEAYQSAKRKREKKGESGLAEEHLEEMKDLQTQTQRTLVKQIKRLDRRVRLLQARDVEGEDDTGRQSSMDRKHLLNSLANDADSDDEGEERPTFRRRNVICIDHEQLVTVTYEGKNRAMAGCLFLRTPISLETSYFEVLVEDYGLDGRIGVGLAHREYPLNIMPGDHENCVAYHCDSGKLLCAGESFSKNEKDQGMTVPAQQGDVIGCGVKIHPGSTDLDYDPVVFFTRNGEEMACLRVSLPKQGFFPAVGLCSEGARVKVNLNVKWKSPDDDTDREPSEEPLCGCMLRRIRDDCLVYDEGSRRLWYNAGLSQIEEHVGIFQDLSHPISRELSYFEVKLLDMGVKGEIGIGVANLQHPLHRMPGWSKGSTSYHCNDGSVFKGLSNKSIFSRAERGDVIGCGVKVSPTNSKRAKVFFTKNQILFEDFEMVLPTDGFYPTIGMSSAGEEVQLDFDVKWPPQPSRTYFERIRSDGNVIEYVGDRFGRVGAYQSLERPMSREFSYFEVTIQDYGLDGKIGIGLARKDYPLNKQPGWLEGSVAWQCNDGNVFVDASRLPTSLTAVTEGDVIGCGIDYKESQKRVSIRRRSEVTSTELVVYFTLNGRRVDDATVCMKQPNCGLFPIVGLQSLGERVEINLSPLAVLQKSPGDNIGNDHTISACPRQEMSPRHERVRIDTERGCVSYVVTPCDFVGGLQYPNSMKDVGCYFEVSIVYPGDKRQIGIGFATRDFPLDHQPGWVKGSVGFLCDEGYRYCDENWINEIKYQLPQINDIIGCRIEPNNTVIFTHNGVEIGNPIPMDEGYKPSELFPTVCLHSRGEAVKVNLGANWQSRGKSVFSRSERVRTEGQTVWYDSFDDMTIGAVQLKREISKQYPYFEVELKNCGRECAMGVGLAPDDYPLGCLPGWLPGSIGYHCQDGCLFEGKDIGRQFDLQPVEEGHRIGCGIDYEKSGDDKAIIYFTHNGKKLEEVFELEWQSKPGGSKTFYPTIGMSSRGEKVEVVEDPQYDYHVSNRGIVLTAIRPLRQETSC